MCSWNDLLSRDFTNDTKFAHVFLNSGNDVYAELFLS